MDYTDLESVVEGTNTTLNSTADKMSAATDANAAHAVITELMQYTIIDEDNSMEKCVFTNADFLSSASSPASLTAPSQFSDIHWVKAI